MWDIPHPGVTPWSPSQTQFLHGNRAHCGSVTWMNNPPTVWRRQQPRLPTATPKIPMKSWVVLQQQFHSSERSSAPAMILKCTRSKRRIEHSEFQGKYLTTDVNHDMNLSFSLIQAGGTSYTPAPGKLILPWGGGWSNFDIPRSLILCPCSVCFKNKKSPTNQNAQMNPY